MHKWDKAQGKTRSKNLANHFGPNSARYDERLTVREIKFYILIIPTENAPIPIRPESRRIIKEMVRSDLAKLSLSYKYSGLPVKTSLYKKHEFQNFKQFKRPRILAFTSPI